MARTSLTSGQSVADAASYQTAIVEPGANALVLLFIANTRPVFPPAAASVPTVTGNGLTWQQVQTVTLGNEDRRLTCFRALGAAPTAGQVNIDFAGELQDYCAWSLFEYEGTSAGGPTIAQSTTSAGTGEALTATLMPSADPMRNHTVGAIMLDLFADPVRPIIAGAGFTEIHQQTPNQAFGKGTTLQTQDSMNARSTIDWTWAGIENAAAIVLEVTAAPEPNTPGPPAIDPTEALIRRFEPVLFFHPQESFFPVDAKRYVEHAALWAAKPAFDDKRNWGGMLGDPFPRLPLVPAGKLAAIDGEDGEFLGQPNYLLDSERDERFFELGGWKDKSATHEAGVLAYSTNCYADRGEIFERYRNEPDLGASQFWYHAELFDTDRLIRLVSRVPEPDLTKIVTRLRNPVLLCYYLFFPAHEQSVGTEYCHNVEAKEVSCHAGDWQCIAILLDATGGLASAQPKFFGCTGSRPAYVGADGYYFYRPYQFDDEDRTVMSVEAWRPAAGPTVGQPEVIGDHPRFYLARGSHSLYTTPGTHEVQPYTDARLPRWCGTFDTHSVLPEGHGPAGPDLFEDMGAFYAKLLAGGLLGLGPAGLAAALVAAGLEGVLPHGYGLNIVGAAAPPTPDEAPASPGDGKTVRPAGLTLPDGGDDVEDWRAQQGLELNGCRYDFIVDRASQVWWPSDDGYSGFRGRWGQRVTGDFLPRRAGPRFPDYPTMFFLALSDGDSRGLLDLGV